MGEDPRKFFDTYREGLRSLKEDAPSLLKGFNTFYQGMMEENELDTRTKELIAVGIGVAIHCERCIMIHVRAARKAGASREEVMEAAGVGIALAGGPGFTYLPLVKETLDSLEQ